MTLVVPQEPTNKGLGFSPCSAHGEKTTSPRLTPTKKRPATHGEVAGQKLLFAV
jgi:hypothetical protein